MAGHAESSSRSCAAHPEDEHPSKAGARRMRGTQDCGAGRPERRAKVSAEVRLAAQSAFVRGAHKTDHSAGNAPASANEQENATSPFPSLAMSSSSEGCSDQAGSNSRMRKSTTASTAKAKRSKLGYAKDAEEQDFQMRLQAALEESLSIAKEQPACKKRMKSSKHHHHGDEEAARRLLETQRLGVASWVGESVGESKGRDFYECFAKNGHCINLDDCVYVKPEEKDQVSYIMRVRSMWEEEGEMQFRGQWLYRPQDTKGGMGAALHPREVLLSDWEDENPIACVQTKCHVVFLEQPPSEGKVEERFHYVCWRSYNVTSGRIGQGLRHGQEEASGTDAPKKSLTRDRVRELERQLWTGQLDVARVRRADGRWARKVLQEAAHMLSEAMPTMPVPHITKLVLGNDTETLAVYQGGEVLAATTVRHHAGFGFLEVELLAVKTSKQRNGFGALLVHRLCLLSREYGYRWLLTSADDTAVPFFKANGFTSKITVPKKDYSAVMTVYEHSLLMQYDVALSAYGSRSADDSVVLTSCASTL